MIREDFGAYRVEAQIGKGGMSTVYRAVHKQLNRPVALKILNPHFAADEAFLKRFEIEAKTIAKLEHENLVRVYDFGMQDYSYYIAMEIVDGPDLLQILKRNGPLPWEVTSIIFQRICMALALAHKRHVIHRDIKLQNVIVKDDGTPKLSDFGIAKNEDMDGMTRTNDIVGTPSYIPPELIQGKGPSGLSDIYSVGVCLYHAISGQYPFEAPNMAMLFDIIVSKPALPLENTGVTVPPEMAALVHRCLEKESRKRFEDAAQVAWALGECLRQQGITNEIPLVRRYLKDPAGYLKETRGARVKELMARAETFCRKGDLFGGLKAYKEVLGLDPSNREVEKNIEQLSSRLPSKPEVQSGPREKTRRITAKKNSRIPAVAVTVIASIAVGIALFFGLQEEEKPAAGPAAPPPAPIAPIAAVPEVLKPVADSAKSHPQRLPARSKPALAAVVTHPETLPVAPAIAPAPPCSGSLSIYSAQWSYVNIDDVKYGKAPTRTPIRLPCGIHRIRLMRPMGEEYRAELVVVENAPLELKIREDEYK